MRSSLLSLMLLRLLLLLRVKRCFGWNFRLETFSGRVSGMSSVESAAVMELTGAGGGDTNAI